jgi:hypothetical protein
MTFLSVALAVFAIRRRSGQTSGLPFGELSSGYSVSRTKRTGCWHEHCSHTYRIARGWNRNTYPLSSDEQRLARKHGDDFSRCLEKNDE